MGRAKRRKRFGMDIERNADFEDVRIVAADKEATRQSIQNPGLYQFAFRLAGTVTIRWQDIFNQLCAGRIDPSTRAAKATADHVVITCPIDEFADQLKWLNTTVQQANAEYREWRESDEQRDRDRSDAANVERRRIDDALDKLQF
jgi:hypothetical protein